MDTSALLLEGFGRIEGIATSSVRGLDLDTLCRPPAEGANPIAWLIWHTGRMHDAQVSPLFGVPQLWEAEPWPARFGLVPDPSNTGYAHTPDQVHAVRPESGEVLLSYLGAAHERTAAYLATIGDDDLDAIVDERWNPPVTLGARLISILADCLEHVGQASYARGILTA